MNLTNFYKVYFDFAFFLCLSPFRLTRSATSSELRLTSWWPQKLLCALNSFFTLFWLLSSIRLVLPSNFYRDSELNNDSSDRHQRNNNEFVHKFEFYTAVTNAAINFLAMKKFWWDQDAFLSVATYLDSRAFRESFCSLPPSVLRQRSPFLALIWRKWMVGLICVMFVGVTVVGLVATGIHADFSENSKAGSSHFSRYWSRMEEHACFNLFLRVEVGLNQTCLDGSAPAWKKVTAAVFSVPVILSYYHSYVLRYYSRLLLILTSFALWSAVKSFAVSVSRRRDEAAEASAERQRKRPSTVEILERKLYGIGGVAVAVKPPEPSHLKREYEQVKMLRELAGRINETVGNRVTCFIFLTVFHYGANGLLAVEGEDEDNMAHVRSLKVILLLFDHFKTLTFFLVSADIVHLMNSTEMLISIDDHRGVPGGTGGMAELSDGQIQVLLRSFQNNSIAIRGSGVFPITYCNLANVAGFILAYRIIFSIRDDS